MTGPEPLWNPGSSFPCFTRQANHSWSDRSTAKKQRNDWRPGSRLPGFILQLPNNLSFRLKHAHRIQTQRAATPMLELCQG